MNKEMQCPFCNENIPSDAQKCPYCAEWISAEQTNRSRKESDNLDSAHDITDISGGEKTTSKAGTILLIIELVIAFGFSCYSPFLFDIDGFFAFLIAVIAFIVAFLVLMIITLLVKRLFHIDFD